MQQMMRGVFMQKQLQCIDSSTLWQRYNTNLKQETCEWLHVKQLKIQNDHFS